MRHELLYSHGDSGSEYIDKFINDQIKIDSILDKFPINKRLLENSLGTIVQSEWSKSTLENTFPDYHSPIFLINSPAKANPLKHFKNKARSQLNVNLDTFVLSSFGMVHRKKRLEICINLFYEFMKIHPDSIYFIVGEEDPDYITTLSKLIESLNLSTKVKFTHYVDEDTFNLYLALSDVCLNLRYPTRGETSEALLKALGSGLPTIVNDDAYFSEISDDSVIKVPVGEENKIVGILDDLYNDRSLLDQLSKKAVNYIKTNHSIDKIALEYHKALHSAYNRFPFTTISKNIKYFANRLRDNEFTNLNESQLDNLASQIYSIFFKDISKSDFNFHKR
jgi:glycosyltransferase involved in cell wall biosynthesis